MESAGSRTGSATHNGPAFARFSGFDLRPTPSRAYSHVGRWVSLIAPLASPATCSPTLGVRRSVSGSGSRTRRPGRDLLHAEHRVVLVIKEGRDGPVLLHLGGQEAVCDHHRLEASRTVRQQLEHLVCQLRVKELPEVV